MNSSYAKRLADKELAALYRSMSLAKPADRCNNIVASVLKKHCKKRRSNGHNFIPSFAHKPTVTYKNAVEKCDSVNVSALKYISSGYESNESTDGSNDAHSGKYCPKLNHRESIEKVQIWLDKNFPVKVQPLVKGVGIKRAEARGEKLLQLKNEAKRNAVSWAYAKFVPPTTEAMRQMELKEEKTKLMERKAIVEPNKINTTKHQEANIKALEDVLSAKSEYSINLITLGYAKGYLTFVLGLKGYGIDLPTAVNIFSKEFQRETFITDIDEICIDGDHRFKLYEFIPQEWPEIDEETILVFGDLLMSKI